MATRADPPPTGRASTRDDDQLAQTTYAVLLPLTPLKVAIHAVGVPVETFGRLPMSVTGPPPVPPPPTATLPVPHETVIVVEFVFKETTLAPAVPDAPVAPVGPVAP